MVVDDKKGVFADGATLIDIEGLEPAIVVPPWLQSRLAEFTGNIIACLFFPGRTRFASLQFFVGQIADMRFQVHENQLVSLFWSLCGGRGRGRQKGQDKDR